MNSWESPHRNLTRERSSSSWLRWWRLSEHLQQTKRFAVDSEIAKIFLEGDGGFEGFLREVVWQHHPQPPLVPCYNNPKEGHPNLGNLFPKQKIPTHSQSANSPQANCAQQSECYRGAVRPPFIEAEKLHDELHDEGRLIYRGAVRPPFIEADRLITCIVILNPLSGGSPPPLH